MIAAMIRQWRARPSRKHRDLMAACRLLAAEMDRVIAEAAEDGLAEAWVRGGVCWTDFETCTEVHVKRVAAADLYGGPYH